ncbi:MAG TPA: FtsW/RodA/SpoVE family cell cycle protein [Actinomycetota bacterium]|jgi:cell division protein FtsW (lipid II flippase)|nr:FtsW/RodA/SpoVE family cell cycle protein [Actinomycetota bacterium]
MSAAAAPRMDPSRARRNTELGLLILAVSLALGAYALVGLGKEERVPTGVAGYGALLAGGYLFAHLVVRRFAPDADPIFLPTAGLLAGLGFAVVYRLDPERAAAQASWLVFGLALFALTLIAIRDHRQLDAYTYTIGLIGVLLLLLPLAPGVGTEIRGARVWVKLGALQFQPAEIAKVLIVVFAASYLSARRQLLAVATRRLGPIALPEPRHLGPILVAWGVSLAVLFFEKDLGSSLLFFGLVVVMLWVATGRGAYLALGGLLFAAGALFAYRSFEHVRDRVAVWLGALDPEFIQDEGFQIAQSLFAMATGGIAGVGLGLGRPQDIPDAPTDFVFAAIGEELGLLGTMAVLLLFVILVGRGFRTALARSDDFGRLLAVGLSTILALQTFVIVGGVTRLIPLTGVTLPFVSYGGSSLVANFVLLALLVRVSSGTRSEAG